MAARRLIPADRRWVFVLLLAALFARAMVPAGWMPGTHGGLILCDGMAPMAVNPHAGIGKHHHGAPDAPSTADHPCAFASPAAAVEPAMPAAPLAPVSIQVATHRPGVAVAVGRGLAAPPPPATGPPFA